MVNRDLAPFAPGDRGGVPPHGLAPRLVADDRLSLADGSRADRQEEEERALGGRLLRRGTRWRERNDRGDRREDDRAHSQAREATPHR